MSESHARTRSSAIEIIRRRVRLYYDTRRARHWSRVPRAAEDALNAISFVFPPGEAFFARSVAHYRDRITDPVLKDQAERFIYQEAMHSKEHGRSNAVLREANVLGAELETATRIFVWIASRFSLPSTRLAMTCALEHFTAMLAERLLACRWLDREGTDPEFRALWMWHAAEELEHKAVCFDVYRHIFGTGVLAWLHLCFAMLVITLFNGTGILVAFAVVRLRAWWGRLRRRGQGTATAATKGPSLSILLTGLGPRRYFDFYRRNFHPWDHDDRALLEAWKAENPGFGLGDPAARPAAA